MIRIFVTFCWMKNSVEYLFDNIWNAETEFGIENLNNDRK